MTAGATEKNMSSHLSASSTSIRIHSRNGQHYISFYSSNSSLHILLYNILRYGSFFQIYSVYLCRELWGEIVWSNNSSQEGNIKHHNHQPILVDSNRSALSKMICICMHVCTPAVILQLHEQCHFQHDILYYSHEEITWRIYTTTTTTTEDLYHAGKTWLFNWTTWRMDVNKVEGNH